MNLVPLVLFAYNCHLQSLKTLEGASSTRLVNQRMLYSNADGTKENATTVQLVQTSAVPVQPELRLRFLNASECGEQVLFVKCDMPNN